MRSLLAMAVAFATVALVNQGAGALADWMAFPAPGARRLVWDLGGVFVAGALAAWVVVKLAPHAPRAHALAFFVLMLFIAVLAVLQLGEDWPRWFSAGVLLCVPLQVVLGSGWALRGRQAAH